MGQQLGFCINRESRRIPLQEVKRYFSSTVPVLHDLVRQIAVQEVVTMKSCYLSMSLLLCSLAHHRVDGFVGSTSRQLLCRHKTGNSPVSTCKTTGYTATGVSKIGPISSTIRRISSKTSSNSSNPTTTTTLRLANTNSTPSRKRGPQLNVGLVGQLLANQALIGLTIWTGGPGYQTLTQYGNFGISGWLLGLLGVIPLIYVSSKVEKSESPIFAGINLSTNMAVLRLFGDSPQPILALPVSILLGSVTGIVEEVTFRGQALPTFSDWSTKYLGLGDGTGVVAGVVLSTFLFAFLHTNPLSLFSGNKDAFVDNFVLLVFQIVTGAIFAILFLTTQNLAVPILAHAFYDFYTFYKTHLDISSQMQYASEQKLMPVGRNTVERKYTDLRSEQFVLEARESFYLMDTNRDGVLSRKELRVALFSYGINLSKMDSEMLARIADLDGSGGIDFDEFLEFVGPAGSTRRAVKSALLGPV